jgi:hypothetical protein
MWSHKIRLSICLAALILGGLVVHRVLASGGGNDCPTTCANNGCSLTNPGGPGIVCGTYVTNSVPTNVCTTPGPKNFCGIIATDPNEPGGYICAQAFECELVLTTCTHTSYFVQNLIGHATTCHN